LGGGETKAKRGAKKSQHFSKKFTTLRAPHGGGEKQFC